MNTIKQEVRDELQEREEAAAIGEVDKTLSEFLDDVVDRVREATIQECVDECVRLGRKLDYADRTEYDECADALLVLKDKK